ncbi:SAG-related sequence [Besnoitia besnoiti]|uniref:SAG-related sequence n=1 Tax=Besnoitia besnoiti TaxID=94643 RepID=A0A2A9ME66_BESBE|nr:SAG-related sequence [Besnoitia besnoiti]PFH36808.1 SAG-related sequence [Besnoitia besnoiti]
MEENKVRQEDRSKVLIIPPENLPFVDGEFAVGCVNNSQASCKVRVTVAARATVTKDQQVSCAYGKDSNNQHQIIKLSPSQNRFTLACGDKGTIVQTNYKIAYCPVTEGQDAAPECSEEYKTILPGYEEGWWTGDNGNSATLTIPKDKFPNNEARFMIQCQTTEGTEAKNALRDKLQDSVCSVDVTIESAGQPRAVPPSVYLAASTAVFLFGSVLSLSYDSFL